MLHQTFDMDVMHNSKILPRTAKICGSLMVFLTSTCFKEVNVSTWI